MKMFGRSSDLKLDDVSERSEESGETVEIAPCELCGREMARKKVGSEPFTAAADILSVKTFAKCLWATKSLLRPRKYMTSCGRKMVQIL